MNKQPPSLKDQPSHKEKFNWYSIFLLDEKKNFPKPLKTIRNENMFKILILLFGNVEQRENFIYT